MYMHPKIAEELIAFCSAIILSPSVYLVGLIMKQRSNGEKKPQNVSNWMIKNVMSWCADNM